MQMKHLTAISFRKTNTILLVNFSKTAHFYPPGTLLAFSSFTSDTPTFYLVLYAPRE